jgi:hypothetical protein
LLFLACLLVFPPIDDTVLADGTHSLKQGANPTLLLSLSKSTASIADLAPNGPAKTDSFTITVTTDNPAGYAVKLNTNSDSETCLMRPSDRAVPASLACSTAIAAHKAIASVSGSFDLAAGTSNLSALGVNQWGATLSASFANSDPSKDEVWFAVPDNTNPSAIRDSAVPTADTGETFTLTIGAKVDYAVPPTTTDDEYQNEVIITATADTSSLPAPEITGIANADTNTNKGEITGGETITITGENLTYAYQVFIDLDRDGVQNLDHSEDCVFADIISDTQITCQTPAVTAAQVDTYDVVVKTWGGATKDSTNPPDDTATTNDDFIYQYPIPAITSISNSIPTTYGTTSGAVVAETDINANCKWSLVVSDTYATMSNDFANGQGTATDHSTTVNNLIGGENTIYVACANANDQERFSNPSSTSVIISITPPMAQNGDTIQEVITATCPTTRVWVVDARDNHTYWIQKINNSGGANVNLCWMETNLAYAGDTSNGGVSSYGDTMTLTAGSVNSSTIAYYYNAPTGGTAITSNPTPPSTTAGAYGQYGYLYNWCATMGKQTVACNGSSAQPSQNANNGQSVYNVCPRGWRLPTTGEFSALSSVVNGHTGIRSTWLGVYSGAFMYQYGDQNGYGYYWTSNVSGSSAYFFYFYNGNASITTSGKEYGYAVRCVAAL